MGRKNIAIYYCGPVNMCRTLGEGWSTWSRYNICLTNVGKQQWTLDANEAEMLETGTGFRVSQTLLVCALYLLNKI